MKPLDPVRGVRRIVYLALAGLFFVVGLVGVVVPGLPTTPFLLLMSYFLIRASPKLHAASLKLPYVGKAIRDWEEHQAVKRSVKLLAYSMVGVVLLVTLTTSSFHAAGKIVIAALCAAGIYVVYRLPTLD